MSRELRKIAECVSEYDAAGVVELVEKCLNDGVPAKEILTEGLMPAMDKVGEEFKNGLLFVPEVLMASQAMMGGVDLLRPLLANDEEKKIVAVIGTVEGDLHDIGKKIVGMMLEGAGFSVIDLGIDVKPEAFVEKAKESNAVIIGMSAMLTTTMQVMRKVVDMLKAENMYDTVKVMCGGAPLTPEFAGEIGANYSYDAPSAVDLARTLTAGL